MFILLSQCVLLSKSMEFGLPALNCNMKIIGFIRPGRFAKSEFISLCTLSMSTQERIRAISCTQIENFSADMLIRIREHEDLTDFGSYAIDAWSKKRISWDIEA